MSEHTAENDAPCCGAEATAAAWLDAAAIVETYEAAQEAAAGLRAMASLLTRPIPPGGGDEGVSA